MKYDVGGDGDRKAALFVAVLTSFLTTFMGSAVNIALPSIGREFRMDAVLLGWVASSYLLAAAVFLVPFGRIADIHGRRKALLWGVLIYTLSSLLSSSSTSPISLICFRTLQGVGGAMIFATSVAILTSVYPLGERGKVLGMNAASVYLGLTSGPILGGFLVQLFGWRNVFLTGVPMGLAVIALILSRLRGEWAEAEGERFDLAGSLIYGLSLVLAMYGFTMLPARYSLWLVLTGGLGILAFIKWETRIEDPVLEIRLFRDNRVFALSNLSALISYSATFATGFLLSLYLQYVRGVSPQLAGLTLMFRPVVQASFSPLAGKLSDRSEPRIIASAGMALIALGLLLLTLLSWGTSLGFVGGVLAILGLGFALFSSPNTNAAMSSVERRFYGVASATLGTMRLVGQIFSMGIATMVINMYVGQVQITPQRYPDLLASIRAAFLAFFILSLCGIPASLARGSIRRAEFSQPSTAFGQACRGALSGESEV